MKFVELEIMIPDETTDMDEIRLSDLTEREKAWINLDLIRFFRKGKIGGTVEISYGETTNQYGDAGVKVYIVDMTMNKFLSLCGIENTWGNK